MANEANNVSEISWSRNLLALGITGLSVLGVLIMAIILIYSSEESQMNETTRTVMTAVLPLFGTWVGTVLAYYFSKDNFEAATRSVSEMSRQLTAREKLESIPVPDKMIPKNKMFFKRLPADKIVLTTLLKEIDQNKKGSRVPILNDSDWPVYIVHRSAIDKYIADKAFAGTPVADLNTLTLQNLLDDDAKLKTLFETSFAIVRETSNLASAKDMMENTRDCLDVFITKGGKRNEEVLGWITNMIIAENARV
jgi:hypothetical protein